MNLLSLPCTLKCSHLSFPPLSPSLSEDEFKTERILIPHIICFFFKELCLGEFKTWRNRLQEKKGEQNAGRAYLYVYSISMWVLRNTRMQKNGYMSKTFAEVYIKTFTLITIKRNRLLPYRYIYILLIFLKKYT